MTSSSLKTSGIRDNHHRGTIGDFLKEKILQDSDISFVSAYFTIYAYAVLKEQLDQINHLRFLFGEPQFIQSLDPDKTERKAFRIETKDEATNQVTGEVTPEVTPEVRKMLSIMTGEMTRGEIQEKLRLRDEKHFREHYQQIGVKLSLIEMTIPDKPRSRLQKYRLTDAGKRLLKSMQGNSHATSES